ncbi:MAG: transposase [Thermodesulfobacteriota bacterium]|nr:transposase [Thermodesulfobacteriota bacterium]
MDVTHQLRLVKIKAVAMDMSPAYVSTIIDNLKEVTIVLDHFHIIKLFKDKLSDFMRKEYQEATMVMEKAASKYSMLYI